MRKLLPIFIASVFLFSCVDKTPIPESQKDYVGIWSAGDDSWIRIDQDGTGSFKIPNSNMSGASVEITDSHIVISIMGLDAGFKIDQSPHQDNGQWVMQLDGVNYYKQ